MEYIVTYLFGFVGLPIIQFAKNELEWVDRKAMLLSAVVSIVLGFVSLYLNDALQFVAYDWHNIPMAAGQVLTASFFGYKLFLKSE